MGAIDDIVGKIVPTLSEKDEEKKKISRGLLATETFPFFFSKFENYLKENGTGYYVGHVNSFLFLKK